MNEKSLSIKYRINAPGFSYHMIKGILEKGSSISKSKHPVPEVEWLKAQLLKKGRIIDKGNVYILNSPVKTGFLMALNLHKGFLVEKYETKQRIVVSGSEASVLRDTLPQGNIQLSNSGIVQRTDKHSYIFEHLFNIEFNDTFLKNHSSDCFGSDEEFVFEVLKKSGILSDDVRHGISGESEADIVDEANRIQFEVTYEKRLAPKIKKDSVKVLYDTEFQTVKVVDNNPFLLVSDSTIKKFTTKKYTEKYNLVITILTIGIRETAKDLLKQLSEQLTKESKLNYVYGIVLISIDHISDKTHFVSCIDKDFFEKTLDMIPQNFYIKKEIQHCEMNDNRKYTLLCKNIFNGQKMIFSGTKDEIKDLAHNLSIFDYD